MGGTSGEAATLMKYILLRKLNKFELFSRDFYLEPELMAELNEDERWDELMATYRVFEGPVSNSCPEEYSQAAKQFYFGQTIEAEEVPRLVEMLTDVWLWSVLVLRRKL